MTWGKVDPEQLPDSVVCYCDSTIAMPLLTAYALGQVAPRPLKRLYDQRARLLNELAQAYAAARLGDLQHDPRRTDMAE
jgi:deoxyhypusine synthase